MLNQKDLLTLKEKEKIDHYVVLNKVEVKITKTGKEYLSLEISDKSGKLSGNKWDINDSFHEEASVGDVAKVTGTLEFYRDTPQAKIDSIRLLNDDEPYSREDFLRSSERNLDEMKNELKERIKLITNEHLKALLVKIFTPDNYNKYIKVPAGKAWHHSYISGLLEHTLEIIRICDLMSDIHSEINRDLLVCGAMLHDFGKIEELSVEKAFDYTDRGKLVGHIVIAAMHIEEAAKKIKDFPDELKDQLVHLVLSHQGKLEFASPVVPKTLEAIVLYQADELSAKTNAYKNAIYSPENKNNDWTKFLPLAGTALYIPEEKENDNFKETLF